MASRITTFLIVLIVTGTLVAGLIVGAQRDAADGPVDLIITNGKVYTAKDGAFAEAVAVRGNKILRVGSNREIKRLRRPQTTTVDAHGATVLPGFNDSHIHLLSGGLSLSHLDLLDATTLDQIQAAIRGYAAAHPERPWIHGRGWYYEPFAGGLPTRQQLDLLVPDRPAYFTAYDEHTGWANSKALEAAGITRRTPNPKNGTIVKDPRTGQPTGVLKETAMSLVGKVMPPVTRDERLAALRRARDLAHAQGVTSVQNAGGSVDDFALYDELRKQGELDLRVYNAISAAPGLTDGRGHPVRGRSYRVCRRPGAQGGRREADARRRRRIAHRRDAGAVREPRDQRPDSTSRRPNWTASSRCSTSAAGRSSFMPSATAASAWRSTPSNMQPRPIHRLPADGGTASNTSRPSTLPTSHASARWA